MTEKGSSYENALEERIIGTLEGEFYFKKLPFSDLHLHIRKPFILITKLDLIVVVII